MKPILLTRHAQTRSSASTLWVKVGRAGAQFRFTFRIPGDTSALLLPAKTQSEFRSHLWEHTCFEAFIKVAGREDYLELNFSPSTEWAAYHFDRHRDGVSRAELVPEKIVSTPWANRYELSVLLLLTEWEHKPLLVNFSAVLEERDGTKSYWALAHPPGKPDFHHPDCFALELPAAPAS